MNCKASIEIVYFSGTGCTAYCAAALKNSLVALDQDVKLLGLNARTLTCTTFSSKSDLLIIMYPVHAFDAPQPIFDTLNHIKAHKEQRAAVIPISGGGEIFPNRASRHRVCKTLSKKGFEIVYESMLVMPSNWMIPTPNLAAIALLHALPSKCDQIANELLEEKVQRYNAPLLDRLISKIAIVEKGRFGQIRFGEKIKVSDSCTLCGCCSRECPRSNIVQKTDGLQFYSNCVLCLRCIYGCPRQALSAGYCSFIVIKEGFSVAEFTEQESPDMNDALSELKGIVWLGVRRYLSE